jgi:hypothetical protein
MKPRGFRPSELVPPVTTIEIQPSANAAGWHNQNITIVLTAKDNEGGSGVREVDYDFFDKNDPVYTRADTAVIPYSEERKRVFIYWSVDNEGNDEKDHRIELKLDKTPPVIGASLSPKPNSSGWNNSKVTVTFNATDNLSGIKKVTRPVSVIKEGANQMINGEAIDMADNKATATVTLNIDKTPPKVSINATPGILWPADGRMADVTVNGNATDKLSGIDSVIFKVKDEYGKCEPILTSFGSTIKLEASRRPADRKGRTYTIIATATDKAGNKTSASTTVTCPHKKNMR